MSRNQLEIERARREYDLKLRALSANVKDQISELTQLAQEKIFAAPVIVELIEQRIKTASPQHKLPALYLLDSICKMVRRDYLSLFARNITRTFMGAYHVVDAYTQGRMERMLDTWRGGVTGPVFAAHIIDDITKCLPKRTSLAAPQRHPATTTASAAAAHRQHPYQRPPTTQRHYQQQQQRPQQQQQTSHYNGSYSIQQPSSAKHMSNHDASNTTGNVQYLSKTHNSVPVLPDLDFSSLLAGLTAEHFKLLQEIQATLTHKQEQLRLHPYDITLQQVIPTLQQLQRMVPTLQLDPATAANIRQTLSQLMSSSQDIAPAISTPPIPLPVYASTPYAPRSAVPVTIPTSILPVTATVGPIDTAAIASLLGHLPFTSSTSATATATTSATTATLTNTMTGNGAASVAAVPTGITDSRITQDRIRQPCPGLFESIYSSLSLQCRQCALRFRDDADGQHRMAHHLDRHFKQNRRLKERTRKVISRSWFVSQEDWIHSRVVTSEAEHVFAKTTTKPSTAPEAEDAHASLRAQLVVSPSSADQKLPCPICQEKFEEFWSDEDEEWMLRNAVQVQGKIYHATCHADAQSTAAESPSTSATPTIDACTGTKRKADALASADAASNTTSQSNSHISYSNGSGSSSNTASPAPHSTAHTTHESQSAASETSKKMAVSIQMVR